MSDKALEDFKRDFANAGDPVALLFHVQGKVTAGFTPIADPAIAQLLKKPNMPNYQGDMGQTDTGGQTAHVFEKLFYCAERGIPSVMFTLSHDRSSTTPRIEKHTNNAYVVYLPYSIIKQAGIPDNHRPDGMVTKEELVAHRQVFDHIAQESLKFMRNNIKDFNHRGLMLSGHYIDGGQSVLRVQNVLKGDSNFQGKMVSLWNPHTLGIDKLQSLLGAAVKELDDYLKWLDPKSSHQDLYEQVKNHPLIQAQRNILAATHARGTPDAVAKMIADYLKDFDAQSEDLKKKYQALLSATSNDLGPGHSPTTPDEFINNSIRKAGLYGLNATYSFKDRLELESPSFVSQFDGLAAISDAVKAKLSSWSNKKVIFIRNGIDTTIFAPDSVLNNPTAICAQVKKLVDRAWTAGGAAPPISAATLQNSTVFVAVSRPDARKGSATAINAFARFLEENPDQKSLLLFGAHKPEKGEKSDYFESLLQLLDRLDKEKPGLKIKEKVKFLPTVKSYEARLLYALPHAVGLSPSDNEPWGIVGVEQVASGIPVIGSDLYASVQYFKKLTPRGQDSILLFPSPASPGVSADASAAALATHMKDVATHYARYKTNAEANASIAIQHSDWKAMTDTYLKFAQDLSGIPFMAGRKNDDQLSKAPIPARDIHFKSIVFQDIDGCITPNIDAQGRQAHPHYSKLAEQLSAIREAGGVSVLSTGRPLAMVTGDPLLKNHPVDYAITSVGVEIAKKEGDRLVPFTEYEHYLLTPPKGKQPFDKQKMDTLIKADRNDLQLRFVDQPSEKVSGQRLGYYVTHDPKLDEGVMSRRIVAEVTQRLGADLDYQVLPSLDPHHGQWNVDIMPSKASKIGAADWLATYLKAHGRQDLNAAIVWGDSGNDIPAMAPDLYSKHGLKPAFIAPANADTAVTRHLRALQDRGEAVVHFFSGNPVKPEESLGGAGGIYVGLQEVIPQLNKGVTPPTTADGLSGGQLGGSRGKKH